MLSLAGRFGDIVVIPPWYEGGFEEGKKVVVASARRYHREDKLSFADLWFGFQQKYDRQMILGKVEAAKKSGCEYFIVGFPESRTWSRWKTLRRMWRLYSRCTGRYQRAQPTPGRTVLVSPTGSASLERPVWVQMVRRSIVMLPSHVYVRSYLL